MQHRTDVQGFFSASHAATHLASVELRLIISRCLEKYAIHAPVGSVVLSWTLSSATSRDVVSVGSSMFIRYLWLTSFGVKNLLNAVLFLT